MSIFPRVRVGEPIRHHQLSVFPLFADAPAPVEYLLAADAIAKGTVKVEELGEAGSVPTLSVTNETDMLILFLEGEQLVGAKQNRMLNASILVGARRQTTIPVSCVEKGRWRAKSKEFCASKTFSPSKLRHALKSSVSRSLLRGFGHTSDQGKVWKEVASHQNACRVVSSTGAREDTFDAYRDQLAELRKRIGYVEGAVGVAVTLRGRVTCLDLFDKPSTCQQVWDRILSGVLLDALHSETSDNDSSKISDVERFIADLGTAPWEAATPVGEGKEFRSANERGTQASALCYAHRIVHGSAVAE